MSIGGDRWEGTLPYLFGTPANRLMLFMGRGFMHIIDGFFGVVIGLTWGAILLGVDYSQTNLAALALTILVTTFSTAGLGSSHGLHQPDHSQCDVHQQYGLFWAFIILWCECSYQYTTDNHAITFPGDCR